MALTDCRLISRSYSFDTLGSIQAIALAAVLSVTRGLLAITVTLRRRVAKGEGALRAMSWYSGGYRRLQQGNLKGKLPGGSNSLRPVQHFPALQHKVFRKFRTILAPQWHG